MLPSGTMVGGYRIESFLGEGGMATVYEARQLSLNRMVALKVLAQRLGSDPDFRERFKRECEIQAGLEHPNIVHVYEANDSEYGLWLAMRLVEGPTLRELLAAERLEPARTLRLLGPIASAIDAAHESRLIHRDITPQNILIGPGDHPYLTDFGITKTFGDRSLTVTGRWLGTLAYLSPEQIQDEEESEATDIYALATILFECLTGRIPFDKKKDAALVYAHVHEAPPRVTAVEPELPRRIDRVLARGLAKDPGERYPRASQLIDAAADALSGHDRRRRGGPVAGRRPRPRPQSAIDRSAATRTGEGPPPPPPASVPRREPERRSFALLGLIIFLLFAGALAAGFLSADDSQSAEPMSVRSKGLTTDLPPGWTRTSRPVVIPGLPLSDPLSSRPADGDGAVVAGFSAARGQTLLPPGLQGAKGEPPRSSPVALGDLQALRYDGLHSGDSAAELTVFAVPTSLGTATVACSLPLRGADLLQWCEQIASSLKLNRGRPYPLGPSPRLEQALDARIGSLDRRRRELRRALDRRGGASGQAADAARLAKAFRGSARALSAVVVTPQSAPALGALVAALRSGNDAYRGLANAAESQDASAYVTAKERVRTSESAVDERLLRLRRLGYDVGLPAGKREAGAKQGTTPGS